MQKNKNKKTRLLILCGGKSAEHDVSIMSARNIVQSLNKDKYEIKIIGIDKQGNWWPISMRELVSATDLFSDKKVTTIKQRYNLLLGLNKKEINKIDVVFPILHGPMGEDGTVQGFLKLVNLPFVGAGVIGSAIGMDKEVSKRLLRDAGLPIVKFLTYQKCQKDKIIFEKVKRELGLPLFIKPVNLGSSVGITKVHNKKEFIKALTLAFGYDNKVIIEKYVKGREIECSVLGNEQPQASICGEIIPHEEFYSYEAKYLNTTGASLIIPARLTKHLEKKIQQLAIKAFQVLNCEGMARVDFFVAEREQIFINEINTIPGFTSISMYPKLWEASGLAYTKLIDTLIELALARFKREQELLISVD